VEIITIIDADINCILIPCKHISHPNKWAITPVAGWDLMDHEIVVCMTTWYFLFLKGKKKKKF